MTEAKEKKTRAPKKSVTDTLHALYEGKKKERHRLAMKAAALENQARETRLTETALCNELSKLEKVLDIKPDRGAVEP